MSCNLNLIDPVPPGRHVATKSPASPSRGGQSDFLCEHAL